MIEQCERVIWLMKEVPSLHHHCMVTSGCGAGLQPLYCLILQEVWVGLAPERTW